MTVMTHVKALQAGQYSQGTYEPITPALFSVVAIEDVISKRNGQFLHITKYSFYVLT